MKRYDYLCGRIFALIFGLVLLAAILLLVLAVAAFSAFWCVFVVAVGVPLLLLLVYFAVRWGYKPYRETERLLELFVEGYTQQDIYNLRHPFSHGMEEALKKLSSMLDTHELITASRKQAQYLALQNQINPHFLYNTLEGIRGEAIAANMENIAKMAEALATFFRYTISNVDQLATLEDELGNIQNYFTIQQYRFGSRIRLSIQCDEEDREQLHKCRLPKLTLQPIVENAIIHGVERKMGSGHIAIKLVSTEKRLIVTVSDDGFGIEDARLRELNKKLNTTMLDYVSPNAEEVSGIAILNVNNRIQLLFGEEYGITIYSTLHVGTDVEITLPLITGRTA